jgi:hypothetical protein
LKVWVNKINIDLGKGSRCETNEILKNKCCSNIVLYITLDGAELCDGISHITAGVKIMDGRAIDQKTGIPVCTVNDEAFGRIFLNQSHNYCFALKTLLGTIEGIQRIQ